jgi:hypothetical protein
VLLAPDGATLADYSFSSATGDVSAFRVLAESSDEQLRDAVNALMARHQWQCARVHITTRARATSDPEHARHVAVAECLLSSFAGRTLRRLPSRIRESLKKLRGGNAGTQWNHLLGIYEEYVSMFESSLWRARYAEALAAAAATNAAPAAASAEKAKAALVSPEAAYKAAIARATAAAAAEQRLLADVVAKCETQCSHTEAATALRLNKNDVAAAVAWLNAAAEKKKKREEWLQRRQRLPVPPASAPAPTSPVQPVDESAAAVDESSNLASHLEYGLAAQPVAAAVLGGVGGGRRHHDHYVSKFDSASACSGLVAPMTSR